MRRRKREEGRGGGGAGGYGEKDEEEEAGSRKKMRWRSGRRRRHPRLRRRKKRTRVRCEMRSERDWRESSKKLTAYGCPPTSWARIDTNRKWSCTASRQAPLDSPTRSGATSGSR